MHHQAVRGLDRHLKDAHGLRKQKERRPILDLYDSLVLLPPKDVPRPPDGSAPFEALGKPLDGFKCVDCGYISTNQKSIAGHCNGMHQWYVTSRDPTHWTEVKVQSFFGIGLQRYFIVSN